MEKEKEAEERRRLKIFKEVNKMKQNRETSAQKRRPAATPDEEQVDKADYGSYAKKNVKFITKKKV